MSKKNSKHQHSNSHALTDLPNLRIAQRVTVVLPREIEVKSQMHPLLEGYLKVKLGNRKITMGQHFVATIKGRDTTFLIESVDSANQNQIPTDSQLDYFTVGESTQIRVVKSADEGIKGGHQTAASYFGYEEEATQLQQSIVRSLSGRQKLIQSGLGPLKGILVSGYSGTGKTALLREVRSRLHPHINWKSISSVAMLSRVVGGAEEFIRDVFSQLRKFLPAVLAIQDLHLLFGVNEVSAHQTTLATLLSQMQKIEQEQLIVVATYNSERQLTRSIRADGKFQKQIVVGLPNHQMRLTILQRLIQRLQLQHQLDLQGLKIINLRLNGFSVGQIKQILREAYSCWGADLSAPHLQEMLKKYRPCQIKQLIVEVPEVRWGQIGGYESVKSQIRKVVELPLQHADKFIKFGIQPSKGILLYGPPGCSKTMMAKAIATESKLNFISIKGPELFSKYVGQSEKAIRNIFKRARACSPCVIFFDQIDAIATQRSGNTEVSQRVLCQLLNQMDGIEGLREVAIVAATNRPQILDQALMRPGRFDYLIYVAPPDLAARLEIFRIYLSKSIAKERVEEWSEEMARRTDGYTGAEISLVCREAVIGALQQNLHCAGIEMRHLDTSLSRVKKRLSLLQLAKFQQFSKGVKG